MKDFISRFKMKFFRWVFSYGDKVSSVNRVFELWIPVGMWFVIILVVRGYQIDALYEYSYELALFIPFVFLQVVWILCYGKNYREHLLFSKSLNEDLAFLNDLEKIRAEEEVDVDTFYIDLWIDPDKGESDENKRTWQR